MSLQTHVQRRGGRYRLRLRTPHDLVAIIGRQEIVCALKTGDPRVARVRSVHVSALLASLFEALRDPMLSDQEKRNIVKEFYEKELNRDLLDRATVGLSASALTARPFYRQTRPVYLAELREQSAVGGAALVSWAVDDIIARHGLPIERDTLAYHDLCIAISRAAIEVTQRAIERDQGNWGGQPSDPLLARRAETVIQYIVPPAANSDDRAPPAGTAHGVSDLHRRYLAERKDLKAHTRAENDQYVAWFEQFVEAKPIERLVKKDVVAWKDALLRFPAQATKMFPSKTFGEILALNASRAAPAISHKTIAKYLSALRTFLDWAVRNDYITQNVASGVNVPVVKRVDARDPFSVEQLSVLFRSPLFTGCWSAESKEVHLPGTVQVRDHRYWAPLLATLTGARAGEILQLLVADVQSQGGIDFIDITTTNDEGKSLKTANAIRKVPIHPELVRLGFLDFVAGCRRAGSGRLFPDTDVNSYSKFFCARYLPKIGLKTKRLVFHSFRHGFITAARDAGINDSIIKAIVGHADNTVTAGYGQVTLKARSDAMNRIVYDQLDLTHLHMKAAAAAA